MIKQIEAIAQYFGETEYSLDHYSGMVGGLKLRLARYENSVVVFKYPQKSNPFKKMVADHQDHVLSTLDGLFAFDRKTFLSKYSVTHYIAVDKKDDNKVSFYTTYTPKKNERFLLDIQVFGKEQFYDVNFTVVSNKDGFYISGMHCMELVSLKTYFLLKNCFYDIKKMFGDVEELNKDLIDMCFI